MEWVEYHEIEPWGELLADARHGDACALLANCNRDQQKKPAPFKRSDFALLADPEPEKIITPEEVEVHLTALFGV